MPGQFGVAQHFLVTPCFCIHYAYLFSCVAILWALFFGNRDFYLENSKILVTYTCAQLVWFLKPAGGITRVPERLGLLFRFLGFRE